MNLELLILLFSSLASLASGAVLYRLNLESREKRLDAMVLYLEKEKKAVSDLYKAAIELSDKAHNFYEEAMKLYEHAQQLNDKINKQS